MIHILNQDDEIIDYFDINDGTVLEPDLIRNIETLEDTLEFSVATKRSINVQDRNRVIIKDNEGEYREFIIMQYESNLDGFTDVSCVGSHLEDFQTAKPYKPQKLERYTTKQALSFMAADTGWEVAPDNEWNGLKTTSWSSWKDRLSLIKQLQTTYDMRLSFYVELGTNTVKHRYVKLVEVNPMFNGEEIVYGENMIDLKRTVDFTDVATALIAIGPEDDKGNRLIIEEVDNAAQNQLGLPYRYLWQIYEPETDDQKMSEARLRTLARTKLNKIKTASVEYTIQSTQLDVKVGDMIRVKNEDFTPELYVEAEIIEIKYNAYTKLCDYKFGILTEYTRAEVYERFNALLETLRERLNNIKYDTDSVINERLEEELAGLERYIEKSPTPPLDPQEGDLWLDTSNSQVAVLKRYENGKWVKSSVTEAHEVNAPTKEEALYTMLQERKNRLNNDFISNYGLFNTLTAHKYYDELDADIKKMLFDLFVDQTDKYSAFEDAFNNINAEQPTIGLILDAMESALRFEDASNKFKTGYNTARAALDAYLEILRSQYTEEKYLDALNAVADKFGLDVVDGKLMGDANFIENMEEIKKDLQQQLNDAKKAFDEIEIGGRNLALKTAELKELTATSVRLRYDLNNEVLRNNIGKEITISFDAKFNSNKDFSAYILQLPGDYVVNSTTIAGGTDKWKKFSFTGNIKPEAEFTTNAQFTLATTDYGAIRNLKVELGNIATDWTPAPEDTDNKITNINQSITNIEGQLKSTVNKDTFDLLNKTVTQQGTTLEQTANKLSSKADKSVVDTLSGTVKNHGTQITQTAEDVASKADKSLLDEVSGTIKKQGTLISQNATDIALRAKTSDLNSVTGRVTKAESAIKVNAGEISSRVKDVDYQTDKKGIIGRLSGAESSITQQSKLISSKVSSTELTQAIDDIELGGENLIPKADLPKDMSHWGTWNDTTSLHKSGWYPDYLWVNDVNGAENGSLAAQSQILTEKVIKGQEYTLSFIATDLRNVHEDMRYCYMINNISGEPNHFLRGVKRKEIGLETSYNADGIPMYLYYVTFKSDITADVKILAGSRKITSSAARFYIKDIKLEKGNKPTGFSLSTKGLEDRIVSHDTKFEQTDKQLSLKATMTDVNKSDKTLSQALSELIIDSSNGLKFSYDSNGRLASYSVGRDGIQFDGSKIRFKASDSIMLQINDAKKAGTDAQSTIDNLELGGANLVKGTAIAKENLKYLTGVNGGTPNVAPTISTLNGVPYYLIRETAGESSSYLAVRINDAASQRFTVQEGKKYVLTFVARKSSYTNDFNYTYLIRPNAEGSNFNLGSPTRILDSSYPNANKYIFTFTAPWTTTEAHILLGVHLSYSGGSQWFRFRELQLQEGDRPTAYAPHPDEVTTETTVISQINLDSTSATISAKKVNLVGDVDMVNGQVRVRNLTASSGSNKLELTGSGLVVDGSVGNLSMGSNGIIYKDSRGIIKYEMNENFVRSSTFGTTTANIYLAASKDYEVRFADIADIPGGGEVNDYTYIDTRAKVMYAQGVANNPRHSDNLELGADNEVRIMNNGRTTYSILRAAATYAHSYNWSTAGNNSNNLYVRPSSAGEVRFTAVGTTTNYSDIRAAKVYSDSVWSHRFANYWIRVDGDVILSAHGSTTNYRSIKGLFANFDALDVNTGSHIYTRVHGASAELRVTARGTTDKYRDIRFRNWTAVSSEKYKTDITEWNYNVLDIIKDEIKIYQYKYKDDVAEGDNIMYQRGLVLERETPSEFIKGDGINQYEMATWTLKGVQELAQRDNDKDEIIKEQSAKIEKLEKQMSEVMQLLKNK